MIFSSWLGTYLDFLMVEKKFYCFPVRLFPEFFKINIMFTLFVLPFGTAVFLFLTESMRVWMRNGIVLILAMAMSFCRTAIRKIRMVLPRDGLAALVFFLRLHDLYVACNEISPLDAKLNRTP